MAIREVHVRYSNPQDDTKGRDLTAEIKRTLGIHGLTNVRTTEIYRVEGTTDEGVAMLTEKLFCEPINQEASIDTSFPTTASHVFEVGYLPGVMNPKEGSIMKGAGDLGIPLVAANSSTRYEFNGDQSDEDVQTIQNRLLVNKTVEHIITEKPETLLITGEPGPVDIIPVKDAADEELLTLSSERQLHLSLAEMKVIQELAKKLERDPTDCELETIAAPWFSEHTMHKTFKAKLIVNGVEKPPLYTRIKETARRYFGDEVLSAFVDNSGVIRFYEGQALCGKVETHNSPSAIEPYGGAGTGVGGDERDVNMTGQGAKVVLGTNMHCVAPPDLANEKLPQGCLHPDYLIRRIIAGVRDYGNRMGIPTANGSIHFHDDFRAKPTVIVGGYGILPEDRAQKGEPQIGDLIVVIGGRTGRDGIHGATFSSGEMTERTVNVNASAVQIGNPIEQKRMFDAILEARDKDLIRAITDCGAAGFSSAIGEMAENIGATVDVAKAPLKYEGLAPWEILLSESQERGIAAIDPNNIDELFKICKKYNVEATVLGHFDGSNKLNVRYEDQIVAELHYDFLKNGLPQRVMQAKYEKSSFDERIPDIPADWVGTIKKVLSHGNVCSKEPVVRQYDHTVQGTNVLQPFTGVHLDGPNDAVVITPILGKDYGMVQSHGLNPILNRIDPYQGSIWAATEAMANYVAVGGDPKTAALINNYIWPYPDEESLGSLDKSVDAVCDFMDAVKRPVVSGKDSLSSTYRGKDGEVIKIPPVLCMSVFGKIPDVKQTVTSDLKKHDSTLVLVGKMDENMGGSTYYDINGTIGNEVPKVDLEVLPKVLESVHSAITSGNVMACHDVSEGGVITTVSEMCFGGDCGVDLNLDLEDQRPDMFLFNETAGCFVIEVENEETANELFKDVPHQTLGKTKKEKEITVKSDNTHIFSASVDELKQGWQEPMKKVFH